MHVSLFTNVGKSQIRETDSHFHIEGVPITVDDAVMNGILYTAENNREGMPTIKDRVVTLSHPTTNDGQGADAYAGESLQKFYSGGYIESVYADNGVWRVNISVDKDLLKAQDKKQGTEFYNKLETKDDIGVSTGLYTVVEKSMGTNAEGKEYQGIATNQQYNHLAMLPDSEPPAGGQSTFMRFNGESSELMVNLADYMPDSTPSNEPSVEVEVETESKESVESFLTKLLAMIGATGLLKGNKSETETEDSEMSIDNMVKALKEANAYKDGMSDDEVKNAYGKMGKDDKKEEKADNSAELLEAINSLTAKVDSLESQLNAKEQAEKDALVAEVNALETGIAEDELKALSVNSLNALKEKHTPVTFGVNGQFRQPASNGADEEFADIN
jgi:hypothetical protein